MKKLNKKTLKKINGGASDAAAEQHSRGDRDDRETLARLTAGPGSLSDPQHASLANHGALGRVGEDAGLTD